MFCECGTGSFKHVDEDPEDVGCAGGSPRERRKHGGSGKVNPYAEVGLDRFSVVLSELETRRAKILRRVGSDTGGGLVLVRFVQSNGDWTPVVVKLPDPPPPKSKKAAAAAAAAATKKQRAAAAAAAAAGAAPPRPPGPASPRSPLDGPASPRESEAVAVATAIKVPARKASFSWGRRMRRRPSRYWPSVIVLTLVSLAVFGRVFAICVASVWWYVLPTLGSGGDDDEDARRGPAGMRMSMEKKSPLPHGKKGSIFGVYEVVRSPKGKRG